MRHAPCVGASSPMRTSLLILTLAALGAAACAPATPIRRSALVAPPTLPTRSGLPLADGEVRVTGEVNPVRVYDGSDLVLNIPEVGAPGLFVPVIQLGASLYGCPSEGIELGGQVRYTRLEWSEANAIGVLPFPEQGRDLITGGLGVRGNIPLADGLHLTLGGELNLSEVEQAVYVCRSCTGGSAPNSAYTFERYDSALFMLPSFATGVTYRFNEYVGIFSSLGMTLGVRNNGFDPDLSNLPDDTLSVMPIFPVGAGVEVNAGHFVATAAVFYPLEGVRDLDFGLSFSGQAGLRL